MYYSNYYHQIIISYGTCQSLGYDCNDGHIGSLNNRQLRKRIYLCRERDRQLVIMHGSQSNIS